MIAQNPNASPAQLAAWRQLWAILLSAKPEQKEAAEDQSAARVEVRRAGVELPPR